MLKVPSFKTPDCFYLFKWDSWIAFSFSILALFISFLALFGWIFHIPILIQIGPHLSPVQFNTALCLCFSGFSIIFFTCKKSLFSLLLASFSALISFLTAFQYIFHVNLGIDQFFFTYNLPFQMEHPGRMAFNTSLSLSAINLSLLWLSLSKIKNFFPPLILSCLVIGIACTSFFGHLLGVESEYGWTDFTRMALHSAISLFLLSSSIFLISLKSSLDLNTKSLTLPLSILLGVAFANLASWQIIRIQNFSSLEQISSEQIKSLKVEIQDNLFNNQLAVQRMADRSNLLGGYTKDLWTIDARNYLADLVGLTDMVMLDKDLNSLGIISKKIFPPDLSLKQLSSEQINDLKKDKIVKTFSSNSKELLLFVPLRSKNEFNGVIIALSDLSLILKNKTQKLNINDYLVSLYYENTIIGMEGNVHATPIGKTLVEGISPYEKVLKLHVVMTKNGLLKKLEVLQNIPFYLGLIGSVLIGILTWIGQSLVFQRRQLKGINQELEKLSKQAEAASIAKGIFLATVSHEIRTPLNAMIGTAELMQETEINEVQKKYIDRILTSSKHLLDLLSDVLDFSKIESNTVTLQHIPTHLTEIIKNVGENLILKAKGKDVNILIDLPSQPLPHVLSDPMRLQQILSNLGNNALKFTEKGSITVECRVLRQLSDIIFVSFKVIDTGLGIAQENLSRLFQSFSQIDETKSRKYGGVGLGLSICKKLSDLMGGEIKVESEPNKGSIFSLEIPFQIADKENLPHFSLENQSILLLDTQEQERDILLRYLTDWKANVDLEVGQKDYDFAIVSKPWSECKVKTILLIDYDEKKPENLQGISKILERPILPEDLYRALQ